MATYSPSDLQTVTTTAVASNTDYAALMAAMYNAAANGLYTYLAGPYSEYERDVFKQRLTTAGYSVSITDAAGTITASGTYLNISWQP